MKKSIKNLYLPGTDKNVGYLKKDEMHLYKRHVKYLLVNLNGDRSFPIVNPSCHLIFELREENTVTNIQLAYISSYAFFIEKQEWIFYNCEFKTPDNLDVIEMAYLYKNWKINGHSN